MSGYLSGSLWWGGSLVVAALAFAIGAGATYLGILGWHDITGEYRASGFKVKLQVKGTTSNNSDFHSPQKAVANVIRVGGPNMEINPCIINKRAAADNFEARLYFTEDDFDQNVDDIERHLKRLDGVENMRIVSPWPINKYKLTGCAFSIKRLNKDESLHFEWLTLNLNGKSGYLVMLVKNKRFICKITTEEEPAEEKVEIGKMTTDSTPSISILDLKRDYNSEPVQIKDPPD